MPTFSEFLFAPWKLLTLLSTPRINMPGMPVVRAPQGGLCYYQDIGGQSLHICDIAGYQMPAFVFYASCLIFLVFLIASISLLRQCFRLAGSLAELENALSRSGRPGVAMSAAELGKLRTLMHGNPFVSHSWTQFEETLLAVPGAEEVYSTSPLEAHLSKTALIEDNVHTALFNAIPGVLTGLGLLMTFVAILDGLSHVSVAANMDVQGIGGLINGLSGKFVSSIVAVTCAVCFVFVERIAYAQPQASYRKLMARLSGRFRRRTTEHLLQSIETYLHRQSEMMSELRARSK